MHQWSSGVTIPGALQDVLSGHRVLDLGSQRSFPTGMTLCFHYWLYGLTSAPIPAQGAAAQHTAANSALSCEQTALPLSASYFGQRFQMEICILLITRLRCCRTLSCASQLDQSAAMKESIKPSIRSVGSGPYLQPDSPIVTLGSSGCQRDGWQ